MYRKILLATDLTEASEPAMRAAFELADQLGSELIALHAAEPTYQSRAWYTPLSERESEMYRDVQHREEEAARVELDKVIARVRGSSKAKCQSMVIAGVASDLVVKCALELGAQLIVAGTHGRIGVRHTLLGSIAERIVRTAHCPVLTVHAPRPQN